MQPALPYSIHAVSLAVFASYMLVQNIRACTSMTLATSHVTATYSLLCQKHRIEFLVVVVVGGGGYRLATHTAAEAAGGPRTSLTPMRDANQQYSPSGAQHPDQSRMRIEPIHPVRVQQHSGHSHVTEFSRPIKGLGTSRNQGDIAQP
jgi:hypothetical protein